MQIFGTCGSDEKMELLKQKGVDHPINYNKSDFEQVVKTITKGEGVDIVIVRVFVFFFSSLSSRFPC